MASLWAGTDEEKWQTTLDGYHQAVEGVGKPKLPELDRWFQEQLPKDLADSSRQPAHLKHQELVRLVEWKLTRGKTRPRLLDYAKQASPSAVEAASRAAFELLSKHRGKETPPAVIKEALAALTVLKGVGPATASAILEAYDPSIPFTSDQAMLAALGGKDYTVAKVLELTEALRAKAKQLSQGGGRQWSAKEVEMCLFADAAAAAAVAGSGGSKGAKRAGGGEAAKGAKRKR